MRGFIEFKVEGPRDDEPAKHILIRTNTIIAVKDIGDDCTELTLQTDEGFADSVEVEEHYQTVVAKLERATRTE